jgi:hypothetical protein
MELMGGPTVSDYGREGEELGCETCQRDCWSNIEERPDWDRKKI